MKKINFCQIFAIIVFFSFVILLVTQKLNFFEENFKIKTSPPFLLVDHILPLGLAEIRKKCYIDYVPNSFNLKICKNLTVIEEFGNEYNISGCVSTNFWL